MRAGLGSRDVPIEIRFESDRTSAERLARVYEAVVPERRKTLGERVPKGTIQRGRNKEISA